MARRQGTGDLLAGVRDHCGWSIDQCQDWPVRAADWLVDGDEVWTAGRCSGDVRPLLGERLVPPGPRR